MKSENKMKKTYARETAEEIVIAIEQARDLEILVTFLEYKLAAFGLDVAYSREVERECCKYDFDKAPKIEIPKK